MKTMKFDLQKDYRIEISKPSLIQSLCMFLTLYTHCLNHALLTLYEMYEGVSNQKKMNNKDKIVSFYKTANEQPRDSCL